VTFVTLKIFFSFFLIETEAKDNSLF